jgi:CheY-like chemotaxis protein
VIRPAAVEAIGRVAETPPAVLVVDIDAAQSDAVELCRCAKRDSATRLVPIVLLSDDRRRDQRLAGHRR